VRALRWAVAAALLAGAAAAGTAWLFPRGPAAAPPPDAMAALPSDAAPSSDTLVVSSVVGRVEVRGPTADEWLTLVPGDRIVENTAIRSLEGPPATVVFEGNLSMSFRREVLATVHPGATLAIAVTAGALAVSPPDGMPVRLEVPQGTVSSVGAPLEVLVNRRRGTLVIARGGSAAPAVGPAAPGAQGAPGAPTAGVLCETPNGRVALDADHHTILFDDRPPAPARAFPFRRGPRHHEGHEGHGPHGPCQPPGGPELDGLYKDGPT
jgi:hypothetical protein